MSKRVEPEIPTITIDQDQVKTARESTTKAQKSSNVPLSSQANKSVSFTKILVLLMPYLALAGTGWYFHQQQLSANQTLVTSSQRIQQLENQLSATGEEMGESTVALKIKLEAISEKTELLLSEMDKLWASAWRKNQKEIKELNSQTIKISQLQENNTRALSQQNNDLSQLKDQITTAEFSINAVGEQLVAVSSLKDELKTLTTAFNTLDAKAKSRDKQQMFTATTLNEFDTSLQLLLERLERIETQLVK